MKKKTPESVLLAAVVGGLLLVAIIGYFLVVGPQRGRASDLSKEIASTEQQISEARALAAKAKDAQKVKVADIFKLTKAMPDSPDEAGLLLDLNSVAERSGIKFESLNVEAATTVSTYEVIPLQVSFHGNFYALADFLFRLRNLVDVHRGALDARGRLFAVDKVAMRQGAEPFPTIQADITIVAFVYGSDPSATAPAQSASLPTTTTTTTTTTPSADASAAGAP